MKELENKLEINRHLYNNYLTEIQSNTVIDAVDQDRIEIIEPATPPRHPTNAGIKNRILLGSGLGLLFGLIFSVITTCWTSASARSRKSSVTGQPVIGAIPAGDFKSIPEDHDFEKGKQIDCQLVTHDYSPTLIGESYRELRTRLLFAKPEKSIHTLVITSVGPEEGKSFTAGNLAIILAQQRSNTLLVDADLRRGVCTTPLVCKKTLDLPII
jgi:hypothetical protein